MRLVGLGGVPVTTLHLAVRVRKMSLSPAGLDSDQ